MMYVVNQNGYRAEVLRAEMYFVSSFGRSTSTHRLTLARLGDVAEFGVGQSLVLDASSAEVENWPGWKLEASGIRLTIERREGPILYATD